MFTSGLFETPFRWVGKQFLGFTYDFDVSGYGSGDNTYAYITLFVNVIAALIITILWSIIDKKRKGYNIFCYWFFVVIRIFLFAAMCLYGFVKIFQIQFQPPSFIKLLQPLGEFSPMGLAWNYMGFSKGFGMFAGIMEVIGGLLLIYRRTSTIGAFIIIGVMTQVAMMNLMFDIPVKLFSIHLILMALIIFMTDVKRFTSVFIKNKATENYAYYHPVTSKSYHKIIDKSKKILIPILLILASVLGYLGELNINDKNHRPHLYGIWQTETFVINNDTIPPLITDTNRWRYLIVEKKGQSVVKTMTDNLINYTFITDTIGKQITMHTRDGIKDSINLKFEHLKSGHLKLYGVMGNDSMNVTFSLKDLNSLPLTSRDFHWINERPYNK
ncbi:hypothetical protein FBALC1_02262 [Flavobacteriales bacterium ALC-1]|nr:hypothetical protein FBALC1_02262 [Flavobacteriales bacterium ALC-1]